MTKEELLTTNFDSAASAMEKLEVFLAELDKSRDDENRGHCQDLKVIGNRIYVNE